MHDLSGLGATPGCCLEPKSEGPRSHASRRLLCLRSVVTKLNTPARHAAAGFLLGPFTPSQAWLRSSRPVPQHRQQIATHRPSCSLRRYHRVCSESSDQNPPDDRGSVTFLPERVRSGHLITALCGRSLIWTLRAFSMLTAFLRPRRRGGTMGTELPLARVEGRLGVKSVSGHDVRSSSVPETAYGFTRPAGQLRLDDESSPPLLRRGRSARLKVDGVRNIGRGSGASPS